MNNVKSILIFGATGACGQAVVERSLSRGYRVTTYVRDADKARQKFGVELSNLTIVTGDLGDEESVTAAVKDHDSVISCLASFEPPHDSMSVLTRSLLRAAERVDRKAIRFVAYSLCGVEDDGDWVSHAIQNALGIFSPHKFGPAISDHKNVIELLESSVIDYTLFQTATMVNKPIGRAYTSGSPEECPGVRLWDRWGVLDAADVCLDALEQSSLRRLQMRYL